MNASEEIKNELKVLNWNIGDNKNQLPEPPKGYFDNFNQSLLERLELEHVLAAFPEKEEVSAPANYFEQLNNAVFNQIEAEQIAASFSKEEHFEIPSTYFEQFNENVIAKVSENKSHLHLNKRSYKLKTWTLAASIIALIGFAALFINLTPNYSVEAQLDALSINELKDYIDENKYEYSDVLLESETPELQSIEDDFIFQSQNLSEDDLMALSL